MDLASASLHHVLVRLKPTSDVVKSVDGSTLSSGPFYQGNGPTESVDGRRPGASLL